jgi:hypothetical protein
MLHQHDGTTADGLSKKKEKENKSLLIFYGWNENEPTSITQEGEIPGRMFQSSLLIKQIQNNRTNSNFLF